MLPTSSIPSKAIYRDLGHREKSSLRGASKEAKKKILDEAIFYIDLLVGTDKTYHQNPQKLLNDLYDPSISGQYLNEIREALKSDSLYFSCLSKTASQVLAHFARISTANREKLPTDTDIGGFIAGDMERLFQNPKALSSAVFTTKIYKQEYRGQYNSYLSAINSFSNTTDYSSQAVAREKFFS